MAGTTIDIPTADGTADAYLTRPDDGDHPGVLVLMDAFGLRPTLEELADRIAEQGYVVLAPNVFYRAGRAPVLEMPDLSDPEERPRFMARVRPLMDELTPERVAQDGRAYLDRLAEEASAGPAGLAGYCMGARLGVWIAAADPDRVAALGGFHGGGLVTDSPDSPHRALSKLRAEVFFGHADEDPSMSPEHMEALEQALQDAGLPHQAEVYTGARHGYTMADTAAYDEAARERHYRDLFSLLQRALGAGAAAA